jgi:2,4-dienoyl-CoA reductase-like NADH-dependent reductase (Old Yellow Enzyme family)/thioredoxin reductase
MDGTHFSALAAPIRVGSVTVRNRFVVPAMGTGFATPDGLVTQQLIDYYEARARGGAGMVIVETSTVEFPRGIHASKKLVADTDAALPGLGALAQAIKKHGATAILQLNHAGRLGKSRINGIQPVAPSAIAAPGGQVPREIRIDEIAQIVQRFGQAARRAQQAGFDGCEVHAAHGYLLATFSSPYSNKRQDQYGGSVQNRARMLMEVLTSMRAHTDPGFLVWCRINGREFGADDVLTLEDGQAIAAMVNPLVDAISISARGYGKETLVNYPDEPGALIPLAEAIRKAVTVPVIAVGRMSPEVAEKAVAEGRVDLIAQGRQSIADPDTPIKVLTGQLDEIRPCIACFYCSDAGLRVDKPIGCQVNAAVGKETEYEIRPVATPRKVVVIGGGPAGLEASRVLTLRGHRVILLEKESALGGQLALAAIPPHKERLQPLVDWFESQLAKLGVDVRTSTEADFELVRSLEPDVVLFAAGSRPIVPPIPGVDGPHVTTPPELLNRRVKPGKASVVIGGGSTGCEVAEFLHEEGSQTTIVEALAGLALEAGNSERTRMLNQLNALPIAVLTETRCTAITPDGVQVRDKQGNERTVPADTVVLACGVTPDNALYQELINTGIETHMIGDCWHPDVIARAVADGARWGHAI